MQILSLTVGGAYGKAVIQIFVGLSRHRNNRSFKLKCFSQRCMFIMNMHLDVNSTLFLNVSK